MIAQSLALQKHTFEGGLRPKEEYELIQRMMYLTWKQATRAIDTAWWLFSWWLTETTKCYMHCWESIYFFIQKCSLETRTVGPTYQALPFPRWDLADTQKIVQFALILPPLPGCYTTKNSSSSLSQGTASYLMPQENQSHLNVVSY